MIRILDSTLREGEQTPGVYFDGHIKTSIANLLDEIGIDIIEAGHPAVTEEIHEGTKRIADMNLNATIGAHARSLREDVSQALSCGVDFIGIFYCVSDLRLRDRAKSIVTVVDQIADAIRYAKSVNPKITIRYTPEDTVRSSFDNVIFAAEAAVRAGADIISIADTTGYMVPGTKRSMYDYISRFKTALKKKGLHPEIAVHCHNDRGLALANSLDALRAGANIIDASVLGLGERAGITDLASLLSVLVSDFGYQKRWNLKRIPELYKLVSQYAKMEIPANFPINGKHAFTHCAGVHTQAAIRNPVHYQSLSPALFGRKPQISLDHMSGISAIRHALEEIGYRDLEPECLSAILARVKGVGQHGRVVDRRELTYITEFVRNQIRTEASA